MAITRRRLVVWSGSRVEIAAERNDRFLVGTQLEEFHSDRSGRFEIRLHTPKAVELTDFAAAPR